MYFILFDTIFFNILKETLGLRNHYFISFSNIMMTRSRTKQSLSSHDSIHVSNVITPVSSHIAQPSISPYDHSLLRAMKMLHEKSNINTAYCLRERAETIKFWVIRYEHLIAVTAGELQTIEVDDLIVDTNEAIKVSNLPYFARLCVHLHQDMTIFSLPRSLLKTETREVHFANALTVFEKSMHDSISRRNQVNETPIKTERLF